MDTVGRAYCENAIQQSFKVGVLFNLFGTRKLGAQREQWVGGMLWLRTEYNNNVFISYILSRAYCNITQINPSIY